MSLHSEEKEEPEDLEFEAEGLYFLAKDVKDVLGYNSSKEYGEVEQEVEKELGSGNYRSPDALKHLETVVNELEDKDWIEGEDSYVLENPGRLAYGQTT